MPTRDPQSPPIARIRGTLTRRAAEDLVQELNRAGWDHTALRQPLVGDPEVVVALTGHTIALTGLLCVLPPTLREWSRRHGLGEYEIVVERGGRRIMAIPVISAVEAERVGDVLAGAVQIADGDTA